MPISNEMAACVETSYRIVYLYIRFYLFILLTMYLGSQSEILAQRQFLFALVVMRDMIIANGV